MDTVPSAARVAFLTTPTSEDLGPRVLETGLRLHISLVAMRPRSAVASEVRHAFAEIRQERPDAIIVSAVGDLLAQRRLIAELAAQSRLPAIYPWRGYVEAGGLMAYASDRELWRRIADDVHKILGGAKPGDIPIYEPSKYELVINRKAAAGLGLTLPPALLATAEIVE